MGASGAAVSGEALAGAYERVRAASERLCEPLAVEDFGVQPMDDASPPKWHLAHTSWFFETFLLVPFAAGYQRFHPIFEYLFNSYYNGVGDAFPRPRRGQLSRPTVAEVYDYRRHVDAAMAGLLDRGDAEIGARTTLGIQHEQQHQELLLTDLKYNLGHNPLLPAYRPEVDTGGGESPPLGFVRHEGGVREIGFADQEAGRPGGAFCFDNETPRHRVYLEPFALADRTVTCGEYLAFMNDAGYRTSALWLSEGWSWIRRTGIAAPLYWFERDGEWWEYRLSGPVRVDPASPVVHVSGYEADAFARWAGCRLPTEAEWEVAAEGQPLAGNFVESGLYHPAPAPVAGELQLFGDVWEWTSSAYGPYPGFQPLPGTLGEYNGKFMSNQLVLRGGSCATPASHIRASYRNFFYPPDRWQFSGIRLAKNAR